MSEYRFSIDREAPVPVQATGHFSAGAAETDITPPVGLPMAGYSLEGKVSRGYWGRLFARALVVEDADGERACVCVCDLMSGTRPLLEKVAQLTAPSVGISVDRLILTGTHTHNGPGGIYGNSLYDTFAQKSGHHGYEPRLVDWLAQRIAAAIDAAAAGLEPALIDTGTAELWGLSKNRSLPAFPDPDWNDPGRPGENPPAHLDAIQRAIDPRVRVLAAFREAARTPIAVFGFFGCHYHATGVKMRSYTSDAAGAAVRQARWELEQTFQAQGAQVAIGASGAADVNTLRNDLTPFMKTGVKLAEWVGGELGRTVGTVAASLAGSATAGSISVGFAEPDHSDPAPGGGADTDLAPRWWFGAPVIAGSEESPTIFSRLGLAREGMTGDEFPPQNPHYPKARALAFAQRHLQKLLDLDPCPVYPLHHVRIGDLVLAGIPGEMTTVGAHRLEAAVQAAAPGVEVIPIAYSGDYGGYFTCEEEYREQYYEGASTLYGRNTRRYLDAFHGALASNPGGGPATGRAEFETVIDGPRFSSQTVTFPTPDPDPRLERKPKKGRMVLIWRMDERTHLVPGNEGALVCVEEEVGGQWQPFVHMGQEFDDVRHGIHVERYRARLWRAKVTIPAQAVGRTLRIRVIPRGAFPGTVSPPFVA